MALISLSFANVFSQLKVAGKKGTGWFLLGIFIWKAGSEN